MKMLSAVLLVLVTGAAAGGHEDHEVDPDDCAQVEIKNYAFVPSTTTIDEGGCVCWTATDSGHNVKAIANEGSDGWFPGTEGNGLLPANARYCSAAHDFDDAGDYAYRCGPHASMTGKVTVSAAGGDTTETENETELTPQEECEQKPYVESCTEGVVDSCQEHDGIQYEVDEDSNSCVMNPQDECEQKPYVMTCTTDGKVAKCDDPDEVTDEFYKKVKRDGKWACVVDRCSIRPKKTALKGWCCDGNKSVKGPVRSSEFMNGDDRTCQNKVGDWCEAENDDPGNPNLCCAAMGEKDGYFQEGGQTDDNYACADGSNFEFDCTDFDKAKKCNMYKAKPFFCKWKKTENAPNGECLNMSQVEICRKTKPSKKSPKKLALAAKKAKKALKIAQKEKGVAFKAWKNADAESKDGLLPARKQAANKFNMKQKALEEADDAVEKMQGWVAMCKPQA